MTWQSIRLLPSDCWRMCRMIQNCSMRSPSGNICNSSPLPIAWPISRPMPRRCWSSLSYRRSATTLAQELSRGMRQKVAICCAYLHHPGAILFDEPLTGLDPRGIRHDEGIVKQRAAAGAAVIVSSHLAGTGAGSLHASVDPASWPAIVLRAGLRMPRPPSTSPAVMRRWKKYSSEQPKESRPQPMPSLLFSGRACPALIPGLAC